MTVHPPRGNRQDDPARRVQTTLCRHTSYTGAFSISCHVTHHAHGYGDTRGGSRNRSTASPSYHGRRKTPTASPGTAGQPHQVTQCHHIGPTPPHTGNRLDSHQCQRGTGNQSHHGHGAHPAHISNRHWSPPMPLFACRFHLHSFPSVPFGFPRGPFSPPMQLSLHLQRTPPRGRQRRRSHRPGSTGGK